MQYQYFNNRKFAKYPNCVYWQDTSTTERMHRYVWEYYNGAIPAGYDIHHIDHNVDNNSIDNLMMLAKDEHAKLHAKELSPEEKERRKQNALKAQEFAKEWHSTEAGHEWHKRHYEQMKERLHVLRDFICKNCGKPFQSTKAGSKFCCNACKSKYRRTLGLDLIELTCPICGKKFKTNKFDPSKTCGRKCSYAIRKSQKDKTAIA
jgi:rubrerythrin